MTIRNQRHIISQEGNFPVVLQDQVSPALIVPMLQPLVSTTITATVVKDTYTCTVASAVGISIGDLFRIIDPVSNRFYQGAIINLVGTTVTTDAPFDFAYLSGSEFATGNFNMAVNGSITPVVFRLRIGTTSIPAIADVTRMIMVCECDGAVDFNKFGDIVGGLTRGIMFRSRNGIVQNLFTVRTNKGLAGIAYDFTVFSASNPAQGINGFAMRLTFAGQEKLGVVLRTGADDNLEMWIQDDLSSLISLSVTLEGHVVVD